LNVLYDNFPGVTNMVYVSVFVSTEKFEIQVSKHSLDCDFYGIYQVVRSIYSLEIFRNLPGFVNRISHI
jgi:hypothetical protein